jgi:WD40 repeat protein
MYSLSAKDQTTHQTAQDRHIIVVTQPQDETTNKEDNIAPVPPPRRKKKSRTLMKQSSAEDTLASEVESLRMEDKKKINSSSWPRGEKPSVRTTDMGSLPRVTKLPHPSVSIEPNVSLELTEELLKEQEVNSVDSLPSKAVGSNATGEGVFIYSDDDESIDGDGNRMILVEREEEGGGLEEGGATGLQPSESEILEDVFVKNLDTGESIPLSLAEQKIPKGWNNPVDSYCQQTSSGLNESWEKGLSEEMDMGGNGLGETGASRPKQSRKKRFKKLFGNKKNKSEGRGRDTPSGSDDEATPERDIPHISNVVKYKTASHNKGTLDFEQVRLKQELSHSQDSRALWVMEFSICGRLLATAGQDSVVKVWVLRNSYHFFHELQIKYARIGVHSSIDSLSEKSSVASSQGSDDDLGTARPFLDQPLCTYSGHTADILDLSWSKNFFLLSSSMDKTVRLWHISRKECLCCFQHVDFVTAIAFHPRDDRYFLSGSLDGKLRLWNIPDKKVALWNEVEGVGSHLITAANFCMNGRLAVAGTYDGRCIFYETEHLKYHTQIHVRSRHGKNRGRKISGIDPLPGEDKILVTSNDSRIRLYNLRDHSLSCKYKGYLNSSSQIKATFSRDGQYIISGSEDGYVYVWKTHHDFSKLSSVRRDRNDFFESFTAHSAPVTTVSFAPVPGITVDEGLRDIGEVVVAGDYKGNIKVYVTSEEL